MRKYVIAALVPAVSVFASLLACEGILRVMRGEPVFALRDFRNAHVEAARYSVQAEYDPVLGWRQIANFTSPDRNTLEHGVRRNSAADGRIRTGGMLAVGDSFTAGSEVRDNETWPAHLERMIGVPVVNGIVTWLVMQHGADVIRKFDSPRAEALAVESCAREMGIHVIDEFDSLKAVYRANPEQLKAYYVMRNNGHTFGHMSSRGNENIASLIAQALKEP